MNKHVLLMSCAASALALMGSPAYAAAAAASAAGGSGGTTVGELVVTAEKREQNIQDVPVAISAYTAAKRQLIGIDSIQDMTNFTPGLEYNSSTDRISLRGVGRLTNVLSADASVANYSDGVYETFAVGAGASTLFLDRVEILRGPQGTLYGRNAIGGAINEISRHPTTEPYAEIRGTFSNYDHYNLEAAISGPLSDNVQARLAGAFEKQSRGWIHNIVPGVPDEGNVIDTMFIEGQIQAKFSDHLDGWLKVGYNQWNNGGGGPGSASGGWTPGPFVTSEFGNGATELNPGYGCTGIPTNVVNASPLGCVNPAQSSPWLSARAIPYRVTLPYAFTISAHLTYHLPGADIKYITGGVNYHYILTGPSGGIGPQGVQAPITSYTVPGAFGFPGGLVIHPQESFNYQEKNAFWSHEINIISTTDSPLQYVLGAYYFRQHYDQPVYTEDAAQPQWNGPFGAPAFFCAKTGGVCAPETGFRRFDNRPSVTAKSEAVFAQIDWKFAPTLKTTLGIRYSHDSKEGSESVRILCFAVPSCFVPPEDNPFIAGGIPAVDLTQLGTVVDAGTPPAPGVTGPTTYNAATGLASRHYYATWQAVTGTAGLEWTPDSDTLVYAKYSRGYKSGGFNIGIFTVLSFQPLTAAEHVDSFEIGLKKTLFRTLTADMAAFYYNYNNLQIPITIIGTSGSSTAGLASTSFYNVPSAVSRGFEIETIWQPIHNLSILFNYSFLDTYSKSGQAVDIADPDGLAPGATPLPCTTATPCQPDVFTGGQLHLQSLAGNRLPNAPKNKIAINGTYSWDFQGGRLSASLSYIWRDAQYGTLFTRSYNRAPSWDQVDARLTWNSPNGRLKIIGYGKNLFNKIGYDAGAGGFRMAGSNDVLASGSFPFFAPRPFIQAPGIVSTYSVTPPRTYGVEIDYKFF